MLNIYDKIRKQYLYQVLTEFPVQTELIQKPMQSKNSGDFQSSEYFNSKLNYRNSFF